jgi:hypothetical protein
MLRLWLVLLVALTITTPAPWLFAQGRCEESGAGLETRNPQPTQPAKVTCTVKATVLSVPLSEALRLYRTGKFDESAAAYNAIISTGGPDAVLAYAGLTAFT